MEIAGVAVNAEVVVASAMATLSTWLFGTVVVVSAKGGCALITGIWSDGPLLSPRVLAKTDGNALLWD